MGTPVAPNHGAPSTPSALETPGANVTIDTSASLERGKSGVASNSNSTALEFDGALGNDCSHNISSPSVSPVKEYRENSMSSSFISSS